MLHCIWFSATTASYGRMVSGRSGAIAASAVLTSGTRSAGSASVRPTTKKRRDGACSAGRKYWGPTFDGSRSA